MKIVILLLIALMISSPESLAAPCCAGSSSVPALITGDEAQFISFGIQFGTVIADPPASGRGWPVFRDEQSLKENRVAYSFNFATLVDGDRWQSGLSIPLLTHSIERSGLSESSTQLGDVSWTLGYETLPEYEYSEWKPRIYHFLQVVAPTGKNFYEAEKNFTTDAGGLGFWQWHLGMVALKKWSHWDTSVVVKYGRYLGRDFQSPSQGLIFVDSTGSWMGGLLVGYSFSDRFRFGMGIEPQFLYPQDVNESGGTTKTLERLVWNASITTTVVIASNTSVVVSYADQTWVGPVSNTTLSRILGLAVQHRIER
jgi:hypothetical protein